MTILVSCHIPNNEQQDKQLKVTGMREGRSVDFEDVLCGRHGQAEEITLHSMNRVKRLQHNMPASMGMIISS